MRRIRLIVLALGFASASPAGARAAFMFTSDWTITKLTASPADLGSAASAFGATATMNGQILDVRADAAVAKADASAIADPNAASESDAAVEFERGFQLLDPTNAWNVTLTGALNGNLNAMSSAANINASATVLATAFVADAQGNILFRIGGTTTVWERNVKANNNTKNLPIMEPLSNLKVLPNGQYTVEGLLEVTAKVDQALLAAGSADAAFFNSLTVSLTAQPVPEPPGLAQAAAGALVLIAFGTWRCWRRRAAQRMGLLPP
jgi:hypothetical protein